MMPSLVSDKPRRKKHSESIHDRELAAPLKEPVHCQPVSPCDDLQARITNRAYELYVDHGYRQGRALDDWLEGSGRSSVSNTTRSNVRQGCPIWIITE